VICASDSTRTVAPVPATLNVISKELVSPTVTKICSQVREAAADILHIQDGILAEHWDVIQDEATEEQSKSKGPMIWRDIPIASMIDAYRGWPGPMTRFDVPPTTKSGISDKRPRTRCSMPTQLNDKGHCRQLAYGYGRLFAQPPLAFRFRRELSPYESVVAPSFRS